MSANRSRTERWAPVETTQRRLRCVQPPRRMPREFGGTQGCSHNLGRTRWGEEECIWTNYDTICTVCLMYYVRNRSEVSGAEVRRSKGSERSKSGVRDSEVQGAVVQRFEYQFQPSRNRYVTPDCNRLQILLQGGELNRNHMWPVLSLWSWLLTGSWLVIVKTGQELIIVSLNWLKLTSKHDIHICIIIELILLL